MPLGVRGPFQKFSCQFNKTCYTVNRRFHLPHTKGFRMSYQVKIREEARKLNPIDDLMFRKMAEDKEFCQEIFTCHTRRR
jgi:hypothetical protein